VPKITTTARLQQANIVPLLAEGTAGGVPCYTMPFLTGKSLRALLARGAARYPKLLQATGL